MLAFKTRAFSTEFLSSLESLDVTTRQNELRRFENLVSQVSFYTHPFKLLFLSVLSVLMRLGFQYRTLSGLARVQGKQVQSTAPK